MSFQQAKEGVDELAEYERLAKLLSAQWDWLGFEKNEAKVKESHWFTFVSTLHEYRESYERLVQCGEDYRQGEWEIRRSGRLAGEVDLNHVAADDTEHREPASGADRDNGETYQNAFMDLSELD